MKFLPPHMIGTACVLWRVERCDTLEIAQELGTKFGTVVPESAVYNTFAELRSRRSLRDEVFSQRKRGAA